DLHLGGGEVGPLGPFGQPAGEEGLARAVLAAYRLEHRAAGGDRRQFLCDRGGEPVQADRELVQAGVGDRAAPQRVEDLPPPGRAYLHRAAWGTSNCSSSSARFSRTVWTSPVRDRTG